jgi:predicted RNA-binding protein YlqC (UPF0109 family)
MPKQTEETIEKLKDLVGHIVREIVDHPEDVTVDVAQFSVRMVIELHTNDRDVGQVIGQGGHVVMGLRSIVAAFGGKNGCQVTLDYVTDYEKGGGRRSQSGR